MKKTIYFIVALLSLPIPVIAFDKSDWPSSSAMYSGIAQREILLEKQKLAQELVSKISIKIENHKPFDGKYLAQLFKKHNEDWVAYVASTCNTIGTMSGAGGSWPSTYALRCASNMTDQRLFNLTNTHKCIKRHIKNKQVYEIPQCLYQSFTVKY